MPTPAPARVDAVRIIDELWYADAESERAMSEARSSLAAAAGMALGLKPMPHVATRALELTSNPRARVDEMRRLLEQDASIASAVLRVANSIAYAPAIPIGSIEQALIRLGNTAVREIVVGVAVLGLFTETRGVGASFRDHAARVASIARVLGAQARIGGLGGSGSASELSDLFLVGLLHDIGKLLFLQVDGIDYASLDPYVLTTPDSVHVVERLRLGYDHAVLGAHVLDAWGLPPRVAKVVAWHHQPERAYAEGGDVASLVAIVRTADRLEHTLSASHAETPEALEELVADGGAERAGITEGDLHALWPQLIQAHGSALF